MASVMLGGELSLADTPTPESSEAMKGVKGRDGLVAVPLLKQGEAAAELPKRLMGVGIDDHGKVYVTETHRLSTEDFSLLRSPYLHEQDMALTRVEEKQAWIRKNFSAAIIKSQNLKDWNEDGTIDLADLEVRSEQIYTLADTDGDGVFDQAELFAEGFNSMTAGVAHSVTPIGDSVYATILPDLWKLNDKDGDGEADAREILAHGFATHIGYGNHDLHCVVRGYDGKIYWSMGDRGTSVLSAEGKRFAYPHTGTVLRCNLDGTDFEVFASGLRNCQAFDFDDYGNLIAVDHDADFQGEMERLVFLPEGSDSGWRNHYQYLTTNRVLKDAARDLYSPWLAEEMWKPLHDGQPSHFLPPIENSWNAPASFSYQPGEALGGKYREHFFLGSGREIKAFRMVPDGASFRREGEDTVLSGMAGQVLSSAFAPDGRLYFTVWNPRGEVKPLWALGDGQTGANKVAGMLGAGFAERSIAELRELLSYGDRRVRLEAQFELVNRQEIDVLKQVVQDQEAALLARIHALWGLIQLDHWDVELFAYVVAQDDAELVAQAARWAGDVGGASDFGPAIESCCAALVGLLGHESERVQMLAAIGCGKLKAEDAFPGLVRMISAAGNRSPVLRESGVLGLMGAASPQALEALADHESEAVRIAAVVALRRMSATEQLLTFLEDASPQVVSDAVLAIYDGANGDTFERCPQALAAVAEMLGPDFSRAINIRGIAANRRLGTVESLQRILAFVTESGVTGQMERVVAMDALISWPDAKTLDPVDGRHFPMSAFSQDELNAGLLPFAEQLVYDEDERVAERAIELLANAEEEGAFIIRAISHANNESIAQPLRLAWFTGLQNRATDRADEVALAALESASFEWRQVGAKHLLDRKKSKSTVQDYLRRTLSSEAESREVQGALGMLNQMPGRARILQSLVEDLIAGRGVAAIHLDVVEAATAAAKKDAALKSLMVKFNAWSKVQKPFGEYNAALEGGNAEKGKSTFLGHTAAMCSKCHALKETDQQVGPSLQGVAGRLTRAELLEAMLDPQAKVAPGYGFQSLVLKDGRSVVGTQLAESDAEITLKHSDGKMEVFDKAVIESMTDPIGVMLPMKGIVNRRDMRDLVAYLATLKK